MFKISTPNAPKRINHKILHKQLEAQGYEVYTVDYKQGGHHYQIEGKEHHEYNVTTINGEKVVDLTHVFGDLFLLIKDYYLAQGVKVVFNGVR